MIGLERHDTARNTVNIMVNKPDFVRRKNALKGRGASGSRNQKGPAWEGTNMDMCMDISINIPMNISADIPMDLSMAHTWVYPWTYP